MTFKTSWFKFLRGQTVLQLASYDVHIFKKDTNN